MHNTKGLEFDTVFVTGLEDDIIPGNRSGQSDADVEEERRIFYVAVTRARKELYLSWAKGRQQWGQFALQYPTRFVSDPLPARHPLGLLRRLPCRQQDSHAQRIVLHEPLWLDQQVISG